MKNIIIALFIVVSIAPAGAYAQTNSVSVNRETLLQLIASLQKQIVILTEQLAQKKGITDRCPNISGLQSKVPEDMVYSRTYDKCLTERELDRLDEEEAEDEACEDSKDTLSDLRKEYVEVDDEIISKTELFEDRKPRYFIEGKGMDKGSYVFDSKMKALSKEIASLNIEFAEIKSKIPRAEVAVDTNCD